MAIETICSGAATALIYSSIIPAVAISAVTTAMIIVFAYMYGNTTNNPKVLLWAKTEIMQVFISISTVAILIGLINSFCNINVDSVLSLFSLPGAGAVPGGVTTLYDGAEKYLVEAGKWIHTLMAAARYHLGGFNILEGYGRYLCEGPEGTGLQIIFCIFGSSIGLGGGAGVSMTPDSGYAYMAPALSVSFNALIISYFSSLNYLFILKFVYGGFIFFFLPLGVFLRSMPFLRTFGSLLISLTICFLVVYPLILSIFYIDFLSLRVLAPDLGPSGVLYYSTADISNVVDVWDAFDTDGLYSDVFDSGGDKSLEIIKLSGNAFLVGVFIPSLAMLATLAAVSYVNRFLGEEIDLSRIVQVI